MGTRVFRNANSIVYGRGALEHLREVPCRRALLMTGQAAMQAAGVLARAVACLEAAGACVEVVSGMPPEPPLEAVEAQLKTVLAFQPDLLVALGGGSVIDATKALWAFYEHPELDRQALFQAFVSRPYPLPNMGRRARLVAIPSTSGTGSETSGVAILVEAGSRIKRVLLAAELAPNVAIVDPEIADHMPPALAAWTGLDALTHALESAVSPWSTDFSQPLALKALGLIVEHLPASYAAADSAARDKMHTAATLAGMAINNSITGLAHGMDKIGLHFDLPHGLTVGLLLPYTIEFSAPSAAARYAAVARSLGLEADGDQASTAALVRRLRDLAQAVGVPRCFRDLGINEGQFAQKAERVSDSVLKAGPTVFSPRVPTADELRQLYRAAFHGEPAV